MIPLKGVSGVRVSKREVCLFRFTRKNIIIYSLSLYKTESSEGLSIEMLSGRTDVVGQDECDSAWQHIGNCKFAFTF